VNEDSRSNEDLLS
jgi:hypothetical protein